jgi:dUTP pyrophosphatase
VKIRFLKRDSKARVPVQAKKGDAGYDLFATKMVKIRPFERIVVPTGLSVEIPEGYYGRIAPRSGLAVKKGLDVMAGVIDSGYRDEIGVVLINLNTLDFLAFILNKIPAAHAFASMFGVPGEHIIQEGDKIAQLIIEKCHEVQWQEVVTELSNSDRGEAGFGSTGI